ncbi:MAG: hypothetical protein OER21_15345 [Gemmatimonadota bacterium]|nr:hypothetical protein [Gemmatimonadota bacterium]
MVSLMSLWLPILLAAVFVFVVSSIIHMLLGYHNNDFQKLPDEGKVRAALGPLGIPPGDYVLPHAPTQKERQTPEFTEKVTKGPVAFMTVFPNGMPSMGPQLAMWFVYCLIVGVFAAYVAGRALEPGADYLSVFRFAGATAFAGYGLALLQNSIWYRRSWSATLKSVFDALVYAMVTAGTLGWLWPS